MRKLTNPYIWLARIRHRCGYGVHSPFAFNFLTNVVYERSAYYAYKELDYALRPWERFRIRQCLHLLFRIANYLQPRTAYVDTTSTHVTDYLQAGCRKCDIMHALPDEGVDLCFLSAPDDHAVGHITPHGMLVLDHMERYREWFHTLPTIVTFDLWDIGIAFFDVKYNKQHYIINF